MGSRAILIYNVLGKGVAMANCVSVGLRFCWFVYIYSKHSLCATAHAIEAILALISHSVRAPDGAMPRVDRKRRDPEDVAEEKEEKRVKKEELARARVERLEAQQQVVAERLAAAKAKENQRLEKKDKKQRRKRKARKRDPISEDEDAEAKEDEEAEEAEADHAKADPAAGKVRGRKWKKLQDRKDCFALFARDMHAALLFVLSASFCHASIAPTVVCLVCLLLPFISLYPIFFFLYLYFLTRLKEMSCCQIEGDVVLPD